MKYNPKNAVWEITYACNMRCKHCGSSCGEQYPDELTTDEALKLCDDMAEIGLKTLTISGGEPLLRKDWYIIAKKLTENGIITNLISNGWYINNSILDKAKAVGIVNIGISLDGVRTTHDHMRRKGSFDRVLNALDLMNKRGIPTVICTSINRKNLKELSLLQTILIEKEVQRWQLQIANPMGNMIDHPELVLKPDDIDELINFANELVQNEEIIIDLADDIGYFNIKEIEVRKKSHNGAQYRLWRGCPAGKHVLGIRANGDIIGCLSIRDDRFIEGNVRNVPLKTLWTRPGAFAWNRELQKRDLTGFCSKCQYGSYCLGGCTGSKLTLSNSLYENHYCTFKLAVEKKAEEINQINNLNELKTKAKEYINSENYQLAEIYLSKALTLDSENIDILNLLGFVNYALENYRSCKEANKKTLQLNPENAYACEGLGICLAKMGNIEKGIQYLKRDIKLADEDYTDPYNDLAVMLAQNNRIDEAFQIFEDGCKKSRTFVDKSRELYRFLEKKRENDTK